MSWEPCTPGCPGWILSATDRDPSDEIQRCDDCGRFADDDAARLHFVWQLEDGDRRAVNVALVLCHLAPNGYTCDDTKEDARMKQIENEEGGDEI